MKWKCQRMREHVEFSRLRLLGFQWIITSWRDNHQIAELIEPLMKRLDAVFAFVGLRQVAARLLENHDGNKLRFYDHLNRIVKVRAFKLIAW